MHIATLKYVVAKNVLQICTAVGGGRSGLASTFLTSKIPLNRFASSKNESLRGRLQRRRRPAVRGRINSWRTRSKQPTSEESPASCYARGQTATY